MEPEHAGHPTGRSAKLPGGLCVHALAMALQSFFHSLQVESLSGCPHRPS